MFLNILQLLKKNPRQCGDFLISLLVSARRDILYFITSLHYSRHELHRILLREGCYRFPAAQALNRERRFQ